METASVDHHGRETAYRYRDAGGEGPTLLCVHGSGGAHGVWRGQFRLADDYPVAALDLSGHGDSDDVDGRRRLRDAVGLRRRRGRRGRGDRRERPRRQLARRRGRPDARARTRPRPRRAGARGHGRETRRALGPAELARRRLRPRRLLSPRRGQTVPRRRRATRRGLQRSDVRRRTGRHPPRLPVVSHLRRPRRGRAKFRFRRSRSSASTTA